MKAPFLYTYLHSKLSEYAKEGELPPWEFRRLIGSILNIRKENALLVVNEMQEMRLVEYDNNTGIVKLI